MIRAAIEKIQKLTDPGTIDINAEAYVKEGYARVYPASAQRMKLASLTSLVTYIKENVDRHQLDQLMVHVESPIDVIVVSRLGSVYRDREKFIHSKYHVPSFDCEFDAYYNIEDFRVWMMTNFADTSDRQAILRLIGNITDSKVATSSDDGISQAVESRIGIAKVETAMVPNPVNLIPFRTFPEVIQPVSAFILRMASGIRDDELPKVALFQADGGAWKQAAMINVQIWLRSELPKEVVVLA